LNNVIVFQHEHRSAETPAGLFLQRRRLLDHMDARVKPGHDGGDSGHIGLKERGSPSSVMAGLVPAIHAGTVRPSKPA